jgi:hypothetical protein
VGHLLFHIYFLVTAGLFKKAFAQRAFSRFISLISGEISGRLGRALEPDANRKTSQQESKTETMSQQKKTEMQINFERPGTDVKNVKILKIYSPKNSAKKLAFFTRNKKAKLCKILIIKLAFEKKTPIVFAENCQKSQKIVIITSTPAC